MRSKRVAVAFLILLILLNFNHFDSFAKSLEINVHASKEAEEYLQELPEGFGTLCYDLYKVYEKDKLPENFDKKMCEYAQEAFLKLVGDAGTIVNQPKQASYTGLLLNQSYSIEDGVYLLVARGTKNDTTVVKRQIIANASLDNFYDYKQGLVTYTLLDYHIYTVMPQFIMASDNITLKMEADPAIGSIQINKNLKKYYKDVENTTFVFQVDIYFPDDNTLYSSEVYSICFDKAGTKKLLIEGIPIGSTVKIKEIYKGLSYETYVGDESTNEVVTHITGAETTVIDFENKYTYTNSFGGGGVTNRFEFDFADGKGLWKWEQKEGNEATINGASNQFLIKLLKLREQ